MNSPNLFVVGAARCGTTSLVHWLGNHPKIDFGPNKEPKFLVSDNGIAVDSKLIPKDIDAKVDRSWINYTKRYKKQNASYWGDGSSNYFYYSDLSIPLIKRINPKAKIIISLRKNDERAYSAFMNLVRDQKTKLSFNQMLDQSYSGTKMNNWMADLVYGSIYEDRCRDFLRNFNDVHILWFEELVANPQTEINRIFSFLNLDAIDIDSKYIGSPSGIPKRKILKYFLSAEYKVTKKIRRLLNHRRVRPYLEKVLSVLIEKQDMPKIENRKIAMLFDLDYEKTNKLVQHYR